MAETVSVITPAYNAAKHIARTIQSALGQSQPPLEVIVVDDGSTDDTAAVVSGFGAAVRLVRKENGGPASARNAGARLARGEWLALLDADDWWFPTKLEVQLSLATDPGIGLIHCLPEHRLDQVPDELSFEDLWKRNWIINSSVLIRRTAFDSLGGFDEAKNLISVEDYNLWMRLAAANWRIVTCQQILVHYTRGIGISSDSERFLRASLHNIDALEQRLGVPAAKARQKRAQIYASFGRRALYERQLPEARRLLWHAFTGERTAGHAFHFLAAVAVPGRVLDLKRNALRLLQGKSPPEPAPGEAEPSEAAPAPRASIVDARFHTPAAASRLNCPLLITTVDAEEAFDWGRPFTRSATSVTAMRSLHGAHRVFERYGVVPTYLVDFPVASQDAGRAPLRELLQSRLCEIGAQLHPWVSPPFVEPVTVRNSFAGNLPYALEREKLLLLTSEIEVAFGTAPRIYRAGRYGAGCNTGEILKQLGYEVDTSVMPAWNFGREGGPDYRAFDAVPFWIDADCSILEIPISAAVIGRAAHLYRSRATPALFRTANEPAGVRFAMARLGLLERIKLTPEGITVEEAKRLIRHMAALGHKVFVLTFHTPSLVPGNTPYVRNQSDLDRFMAWLEEIYDFFKVDLGGRFGSWRDARDAMLAPGHLRPSRVADTNRAASG